MVTVAVVGYRNRDRIAILGEFFEFLGERKMWWLTPLIIVFVLLGFIIVVTQQAALTAFIYALF